MNHYPKRDQLLTAVYTDRRCELDVYHASHLLQDAFTEFFRGYRCDGVAMSKSHGAVWAIVRSKILYEGLPLWGETVGVRTFPTRISAAAIHLNVLVEDLEGKPLVRCRQELCAVDVQDHSLRRLNTTGFPVDLPVEEPVLDAPFRRRKGTLGEDCLVFRHVVRATDTDFNRHMNNVAYVRLMMDAFPADFWDTCVVEEFDIHYAAECLEGEEIAVYRCQEGREVDLQIHCGDRVLVRAYLTLKDREEAL